MYCQSARSVLCVTKRAHRFPTVIHKSSSQILCIILSFCYFHVAVGENSSLVPRTLIAFPVVAHNYEKALPLGTSGEDTLLSSSFFFSKVTAYDEELRGGFDVGRNELNLIKITLLTATLSFFRVAPVAPRVAQLVKKARNYG